MHALIARLLNMLLLPEDTVTVPQAGGPQWNEFASFALVHSSLGVWAIRRSRHHTYATARV